MGSTLQIGTQGMHCIGAYQAKPQTRALGGIVVVQEIFGVNPHIRSVVDKFAAAGWSAIAPALFDHLETGVELNYDAAGVAKGRGLVAELGFERALEDVAAAAEAIRHCGKIGVVGFCWGGTVAFLAATRLGLPAVSYYGGRTVPFLKEKPRAPLLMHFGERDPIIPPEDVAKHRAALPSAEMYIYPAGHGFNCDERADFDQASSDLAWQRTHDFFAKNLIA